MSRVVPRLSHHYRNLECVDGQTLVLTRRSGERERRVADLWAFSGDGTKLSRVSMTAREVRRLISTLEQLLATADVHATSSSGEKSPLEAGTNAPPTDEPPTPPVEQPRATSWEYCAPVRTPGQPMGRKRAMP